jgi:hypothetical protein
MTLFAWHFGATQVGIYESQFIPSTWLDAGFTQQIPACKNGVCSDTHSACKDYTSCTSVCPAMCGADGCGGFCGACATTGQTCDANTGICAAPPPQCSDATCQAGGDAGGYCRGTTCHCSFPNYVALNLGCVPTKCVPSCSGKACGSDGCGGMCGTCAAGQSCNAGGGSCSPTKCVPSCSGKACGSDGCGGMCGTCAAGQSCDDTGKCAGPPPCSDATCQAGGDAGGYCRGTTCHCDDPKWVSVGTGCCAPGTMSASPQGVCAGRF